MTLAPRYILFRLFSQKQKKVFFFRKTKTLFLPRGPWNRGLHVFFLGPCNSTIILLFASKTGNEMEKEPAEEFARNIAYLHECGAPNPDHLRLTRLFLKAYKTRPVANKVRSNKLAPIVLARAAKLDPCTADQAIVSLCEQDTEGARVHHRIRSRAPPPRGNCVYDLRRRLRRCGGRASSLQLEWGSAASQPPYSCSGYNDLDPDGTRQALARRLRRPFAPGRESQRRP